MARFFADEDFSHPIAKVLRSLNHDVLTVFDIGKANQEWPDTEVLLYAISHSRIVLTKNRQDFYRLHRDHPAHFGIIATTEDPDVSGAARRIHDAVSSESIAGKFVKIYKPSQR